MCNAQRSQKTPVPVHIIFSHPLSVPLLVQVMEGPNSKLGKYAPTGGSLSNSAMEYRSKMNAEEAFKGVLWLVWNLSTH